MQGRLCKIYHRFAKRVLAFVLYADTAQPLSRKCRLKTSLNTVADLSSYFPYSRQSKKKSHRGAITARMLANLLHVAGVTHVITADLHVRVLLSGIERFLTIRQRQCKDSFSAQSTIFVLSL